MSGGPALSFYEVLMASQIDGTALNTSTTATTILPPAARFTLPSNFFTNIGKRITLTAGGRISTFTSGTLTLSINFGTGLAAGVVWTSGAITMVASQTNLTWYTEIDLTCRSLGAGTGATLMGIGRLATAAITGGNGLMPATAPAVGAGFDSTATNIVDLFAAWSVSSASNSIQTHEYSLESLN
jgi:hypothetical protein